jgi:glycogen debranching enzyme
LPISHAGAFVFWLEYDGDAPGERVVGRKGYFNIDPALKVRSRAPILDANATPTPSSSGVVLIDREDNLPLDALSILTVVSKWMGPTSGWEKHFAEARDRGYNMLHFTPLQERGESDSPYSIRDQLNYEPSMFGENLERERGRAKIEQTLKVAREQYGLLSLTDVVLNHTANDTKWLVDHPEAGKFSLSIVNVRPLHTSHRFQPSKLSSSHTCS